MNERIQELAYQAEDYADSIVDQGGEFHVTYTKKFAELIVRQCMSVARGMRNPSNLNYKPSDRFVDELRLHFGVEE
jgi:hypothetical protein